MRQRRLRRDRGDALLRHRARVQRDVLDRGVDLDILEHLLDGRQWRGRARDLPRLGRQRLLRRLLDDHAAGATDRRRLHGLGVERPREGREPRGRIDLIRLRVDHVPAVLRRDQRRDRTIERVGEIFELAELERRAHDDADRVSIERERDGAEALRELLV